ncbi:MAG: lysophospholipid acyltransferase family protein [Acidobacteriota bacterium]
MAEPSRKPIRARLIGGAIIALSAVLGRLSWRSAQRFGRIFGRLSWVLGRRDRRRTDDHLALALPELSAKERLRLAKQCFLHQGMNLAELLHLRHRDCGDLEPLIAVEGWEHIAALQAAGQPILVVSGHCGNWETLAMVANCRGLEMAVVARVFDEANVQQIMVDLRRRFGSATIERGAPGAARLLLTTLRRGGALAMLIDQDTKVDGVFVPFFGRLAFTPVGAAKIALRPGVVTVPTFAERLPDGRPKVTFHPPLELPSDATEATAAITRAIEEQVRRRPEQWVWMHRRWRRRPADED